jgi:hypothetical protein
MASIQTVTNQSTTCFKLLIAIGVLTFGQTLPIGYSQPIPSSPSPHLTPVVSFSAVGETDTTSYPNNGVGEGIGLPYTREQIDTDNITPPNRVKTQVTQPVNTQVQQAITPSQRVHTQVRLGFLDKLFSPEAIGELPDNNMQHLSQLENHLYSKEYPDDPLGKRLSRVEKSLWPDGVPEPTNGTPIAGQHVKHRWSAIQTAMANKLIIATKKHQPSNRSTLLMTVGYMEQRLFPNGSPYGFENESTNLNERLSQLERMLFGTSQPNNTVKSRVNRLAEHFPLSVSGIQLESTQTTRPASTLKPAITPTIEAIQHEHSMTVNHKKPLYRQKSTTLPVVTPTAINAAPTPENATTSPSSLPVVEIRYTPATLKTTNKSFNQKGSVGQPWALAH